MVVDDEPFNVQAHCEILKMLGVEDTTIVETCFNGQEAVNLVQ